MEPQTLQFTKAFLKAIKERVEFWEAVDIIRKNTEGGYWLIGGSVYRSIASSLYGIRKPEVDLDFIIENSVEQVILPRSWKKKFNRYGNPKFSRDDGLEIDFVPLHNISSILRRGLEPTIENFLTGTPLTIQSIAYNVKKNQVQGDIGFQALSDRTVAVNDLRQAKIYSERKRRSINEIIKEKAFTLGFTPIFFNG